MSLPSIQDANDAFQSGDYAKAESLYNNILDIDTSNTSFQLRSNNEKLINLKESAIVGLSKIYDAQQDSTKLSELVDKSLNLMRGSFAKSKTAKIVKLLLDKVESSQHW